MVIRAVRPENWPWANRLSWGLLRERGSERERIVLLDTQLKSKEKERCDWGSRGEERKTTDRRKDGRK